jgi:hypothetical protein
MEITLCFTRQMQNTTRESNGVIAAKFFFYHCKICDRVGVVPQGYLQRIIYMI